MDTAVPTAAGSSADQMDALHKQGVATFVANAGKDKTFWGQPAAFTQDPIKPGASFTYEFTAANPGSHMYHSHHNAAEQVTKGLADGVC